MEDRLMGSEVWVILCWQSTVLMMLVVVGLVGDGGWKAIAGEEGGGSRRLRWSDPLKLRGLNYLPPPFLPGRFCDNQLGIPYLKITNPGGRLITCIAGDFV